MNPLPLDPIDETRESFARAAAFARRSVRFWPSALCVLLVGGVACAAFLYLRAPLYRSETALLYTEGLGAEESAEGTSSARSVTARLREILLSRASLERIVQEFGLYADVRRKDGPIDAVEELRKHVEFRAPGGSTFTIAFTGASPSEARAVTDRLATIVIGEDGDLRRKEAISTRDFLDTEKSASADELREAELALASFMAAHPRFALDATPLATGAAIRADLGAGAGGRVPPGSPPTFGRATPRAIARAASGDASTPRSSVAAEPATGAHDLVAEAARARADLAAAQMNLADLSARFTPAHPDVRAAQAEVERATSRLAAATEALAASGRVQAVVSPPPRVELSPRIEPAPRTETPRRSETPASPAASFPHSKSGDDVVTLETEWVRLTRATTEARQHADQIEDALFKARGAVSSETGERARSVVIDPAFLPMTPVPPGRAIIAALFGAVSLLLAIVYAALRAVFDDRVYDERDVGCVVQVLTLVPRGAHGQ